MRFTVTIFCALLAAAAHSQSLEPTGSIAGSLINKATQQPVAGATLVLVGTKLGAVSRPTGAFQLAKIPPGTYRLNVTCVGFEPRTIADVSVRSSHTTTLTIELTEKDVQLESAVVTAPLFEKSADNITSTHLFNYEEVRRAPGAVEDVSRIVQSMPGVAFSNDSRNDLVVRGGAPTENLTVIDGIEIPNINHFGTQGASGGPIGMVDVNSIEDVQFSSGGFRAEYGDKLSSVMSIRLREGSRSGFQGNANLNTAGVGVVLEGPVSANGSYAISARRSYLNLIHNLIGLTAVPNYQDLQAKITYDVSGNDKLSLLALAGIDEIQFIANHTDSTALQFQNVEQRQWQATAGLTWRRLWGKAGYTDVSLYTNIVNYDVHASDTLNVPYFTDASQDREVGLQIKGTMELSPRLTLTTGIRAKLLAFHDAIFQKRDSALYRDTSGGYSYIPYGGIDADANVSTNKLAGFADLAAKTGDFTFTGGLRMDEFAYLTGTSTVFGPRAGVTWQFTPVTALNASGGLYYQAPELVWMSTVPQNRSLSYMRTDHLVVGFEHRFDEDLKFTIEAYDKEYHDYPVSLDNPYFIFANSGANYGAFIPGAAHSTGKGYVRGVDVFLQKKLVGSLYGLISYSYSQARFEADAGGLRPGAFDYRTVFTVIAGYTLGREWEFSAKWRYVGGRPYTPYDAARSQLLNHGVLDYSQYNTQRLPEYHRLDVRADNRSSFSWGNIVGYIELQNVYARHNILQYYWNTHTDTQGRIYQWSFLPVGGFKIEF